ncbi:MAG: hypothetical protein AAFV80_06880 [Bacteroidota bacterium]
MGDSITSFVPKRLIYPNPAEMLDRVREYMIQQQYIRKKTANNTFEDLPGHLPGRKYRDILIDRDAFNHVKRLKTNGVAFIQTRTIFHTYENELDEVLCPACSSNLFGDNWADLVSEWLAGGDGQLTCPYCETEADLSAFTFRAEPYFRWAFSNVGISFYNWPPDFLPPFIMQLEKLFEAPIIVVQAHI